MMGYVGILRFTGEWVMASESMAFGDYDPQLMVIKSNTNRHPMHENPDLPGYAVS